MTASNISLLPALPLLIGAIVMALLPKRLRSPAFLFFPLVTLAVVWTTPLGSVLQHNFLGYDLILGEFTRLNRLFGTIFALIAFIGGVYGFHRSEAAHQSAALLYAAGALGLTFAGDFFTLFVFWEIMAVASTYLVWARRTRESEQAGMRYLLVHLFGGGLLMLGILLHVSQSGSIELQTFPEASSLAAWLILAGVALNTAIPPLHAWLADAYPKATVGGAVFLSAFTTKSAVLILMKLFAGWEILLYAGVIMALYGVVYAVLANDIRGILAYHIISQVGYMVAAVGIGTEMALNGASAHAFSHILYKSLLFMGAGVVIETTGKSKLTELGGIAKSMPIVLWLYMIGAFSISGFPLFNGFISKSMVVAAAGKAHYDTAMLLLLLASVGTFLHTGLKLPYFTWWSKAQSDLKPTRTPVNMMIAMGMAAFFCTLFGVVPGLLYDYLPYPVDYKPYTLYHLTESVQILLFTFIAFWLLRGKLAGEPYLPIDTDWLYRKPGAWLARHLVIWVESIFAACERGITWMTESLVTTSQSPLSWLTRNNKHYTDPNESRSPLQVELLLVVATIIGIAWVMIATLT
ncbi:MAG: Na(+)/H(+) antiporter subunit D [Puniceicoccaceae bacterium]